MIALDTNILVYAVREDSPWHRAAYECVRQIAEGGRPWAIPWPCLHEFLAVVTHPKIYKPPTPLTDAILQLDYWLESPTVRLIGEAPGYWEHLKPLLIAGKIAGPLIHDTRIAALCRAHGVREIWTADRDYSRFAGIPVCNPLV
ncbi:MAG TPA: TA system VapC family ribonuclease toxin [Bryobacteraceae bacterium]|nr:TA system VapC family ribonuclease toxin [Bryobacteraceae bacterium]